MGAGGLQITTPRFLPNGERVVVLASLADSQRQIRAICQVVWQRRQPFGTATEYGLRFIELLPEDRDSIAGFVERGVRTDVPEAA